MRRSLVAVAVLSLSSMGVHASLLGRAPLTPGGTDYQAYYDTALNITWLANGNLAATQSFGIDAFSGAMNWFAAQDWITAMNAANYLGKDTWRLPAVTDTGEPGCDVAYQGTDCGYNVDMSTGEMAHLYYDTLGNVAYRDANGGRTNCSNSPPYCLSNTGPFSNLLRNYYWYGTDQPTHPSDGWGFYFGLGYQDTYVKSEKLYAWAVHDGDPFAPVPIPPAVFLFGSAIGVIGWMRRKVTSH